MKKLDLVGRTYGRLEVKASAGVSKWGLSLWLCECSCGTFKIVNCGNLSRNTKSCGCLSAERTRTRSTTHGHNRVSNRSRTYKSWVNMKTRCTNPYFDHYANYGGAGVKVAPEWMTFEGFLKSMGERPEGTSLSRFGDAGNYEFGNCAWHTRAQQRLEAKKKKDQQAKAA